MSYCRVARGLYRPFVYKLDHIIDIYILKELPKQNINSLGDLLDYIDTKIPYIFAYKAGFYPPLYKRNFIIKYLKTKISKPYKYSTCICKYDPIQFLNYYKDFDYVNKCRIVNKL